MGERQNMHETGERIERALDDLRAMSSPPVRERVDEVVRSIVRLYGAGLERIMSIARTVAGDQITTALAADDLVASLLILHGLHPQSMSERVYKALAQVRPYLGSHGGDIEVVEVDDQSGLVKLRMKGSCDGCPSSLLTVKLAVEGAIHELVPEAATIEVEGITDVPTNGVAKNLTVESTSWASVAGAQLDGHKNPFIIEVMDVRIVMSRVDGHLYAYRDHCPSCNASLEDAVLAGRLLECPACSSGYDVTIAGRGAGAGKLHLDPVPLLEDEGGIRIALPSVQP